MKKMRVDLKIFDNNFIHFILEGHMKVNFGEALFSLSNDILFGKYSTTRIMK